MFSLPSLISQIIVKKHLLSSSLELVIECLKLINIPYCETLGQFSKYGSHSSRICVAW